MLLYRNMSSIDTRYASTDLIRALQAIQRTQQRWLEDIHSVCKNKDPRFLDAFRRWEEHLTLLKLHLHRAEQGLLHFLLVPEERRPWRDLPGSSRSKQDRRQAFARLNSTIQPYLHSLRIDTYYRRLANHLDLEECAVTADVITDFVALAEMCEYTGDALKCVHDMRDQQFLEDLAFYHVLSPWKQQGMPALFDALRWVHAFLRQHDEL